MNGKNTAPLYKYLKAEKGGLLIDAIKWNFTKFLVSPDGKVLQRYSPRTSPLQFEVRIPSWFSPKPESIHTQPSYYGLLFGLCRRTFKLRWDRPLLNHQKKKFQELSFGPNYDLRIINIANLFSLNSIILVLNN